MNIFTLTILFPLLSFIILATSQGKWSEHVSALIGVGGVGMSALITSYVVFDYYYIHDYINFVFLQELWSWFKVNNLNVVITFRLDELSIVMLLMVTGVGFVINLYSVWYMKGSEGYSRFFAYINLFIANMIILVLSDNLLLMYFGWEGVGLCSYLLIGFYYVNLNNGLSAIKAFIITRFGDMCLVCALLMIYSQYHTLSLDELLKLEPQYLSVNISFWISMMLLVAAIGKSAQFPLQTWLVSAMVGPTPVSALIHAATMVTSGVYLIYRMQDFFLVTPFVLYTISVIGAITLVMFSCSALYQSNLKKILAYSTISQIGYMFLALGSRNWIGAIFHLVTHAFFKALLFLAAGSLIKFCQNEQNIFKMKSSYQSIPFLYICFLIGGASLSGFPIITSGFYSKEFILLHTVFNKNYFLLCMLLIGMFLTALYTFRMIFIIFHGKEFNVSKMNYDFYQCFALVILLLLSIFFGNQIRSYLIDYVMINSSDEIHSYNQVYLIITSGILVFLGVWLASVFWLNSATRITYVIISEFAVDKVTRYIRLLCHYGWGLDKVYKIFFINPYLFIAKKLVYYNDPIKKIIEICVLVLNWLGRNLMCMEYRKLNYYVVSVNIGSIIVLIVMFIYAYV